MSVKVCCICEENSAKYKCPKCKQRYCSIVCCNKHKSSCTTSLESKCNDVVENSINTTSVKYNFPTEDTVPQEKLEQLSSNKDIKDCLRNPQVRDIITHIMKDKNPTKAIAKAMTEPIFVELADACLRVVEPSDNENLC